METIRRSSTCAFRKTVSILMTPIPYHLIPVHVEEPLVLVHPDLGHASRVDPMRVVGDEVRVERTEDVTDVAGE